MDDMKEALDKAAASMDPAVRNMALRYRELQQEFGQYEAFFAIYKQGTSTNGSAPPIARAAAAPRGRAPATRQATPRADKVDVFGTAMRTILLENGHPMKLKDVYAVYQQTHPEDQTSIETFRQRLVKRRSMLELIPQQGYWWADAPLAEVAENA